ncbi:DUF4249 domain-containing protein [Mucilaginibacter sp. X5P1]|uniref:DUF4249 domain-containing protein n=1 Tax=Mucilaginibacter sp. X5P1 TaxID=2723088 RepID=UPI001617DC03|nr:DUF4249 domain-containing protein [Mucilaginibacter sp. X5P1]MBB6137937.1 hypothetical protein [Mucilaginibacter sp. X5P1]
MKISIYISALLLVTLITSCTKVIDVKTANNTGALVIEGNITNVNGTQTIQISKNVALSSTNTYPPVTGATVLVTDQAGNTYPFTESPAGTYTVNQLAGVAGNAYTMSVTTGGITYTAKSTMPATVKLDSVTSKTGPLNNDKKEITVHYQDPAGVANQYRFVMYVNGVQVKDVFADNDQFNDGKYVNLDLYESDIDIYAGDIVKVEMQCIDKPIYTYWYTLSQQNPNGPGGGVTPSDPPTNISPTTLGYFSAHSTQTITITVK